MRNIHEVTNFHVSADLLTQLVQEGNFLLLVYPHPSLLFLIERIRFSVSLAPFTRTLHFALFRYFFCYVFILREDTVNKPEGGHNLSYTLTPA